MTGTSFPTNTPRPAAPGAFPPPPAAPDNLSAVSTETAYFSVTSPASDLKLNARRTGQLSISVTNLTGHPRRVSLRPVPAEGVAAEWFTVVGEAEREFSLGQTESYTVKVAIPASVPAGVYDVRFDACAEDLPQEVFTEGPAIAVTAGPPPKQRKIPKWAVIAAIAAVVALVVVIVAVAAGGDDGADAPNVVDVPGSEAIRVLGQAGFDTDPAVAVTSPCDAPVLSQQTDGDTVRLTFAACAQLRATPNLVGQPASVVARNLNRLGFQIEVVQAGSAAACDPDVVAQAPGPRLRTNSGATIVVLLPEEPSGCNIVDALPQAQGRERVLRLTPPADRPPHGGGGGDPPPFAAPGTADARPSRR